jgi:hypothetical protein
VKRYLAVAPLLLLNGQLAAHPHARVDQQAILSLDRGSAVIEYRVVPSFKDGTHMFDHLDANHDGVMSTGEKRAYAAALMGSTRMIVDGRRVQLRPASVSIPPRSTMSGGAGLMAVKANAPLQLSSYRSHEIAVDIGYALFKKGWFIQPFYGSALTRKALPTLQRSSSSFAVRITVPKAAA